MTEPIRGRLGVAAALVVSAGLTFVGLRSGTLLVFVLMGMIIAGLLVRFDLRTAGIGSAVLAAFTLTWNGVTIGPLKIGDVLVLIALMFLFAANPADALPTPPWWIKQLAIVIVLIAVVQIYFPPSPQYLAHRIVIDALGNPTVSTTGSLVTANIGVAFKFVVGVAAIPWAFLGAAKAEPRAMKWLATAFATGSGLSAAVAFLDYLGTSISPAITGHAKQAGRQVGLSYHPNFLAAGIVISVTIAFCMMFSPIRRERILGIATVVADVLGIYASGSRGGSVSILLALALCIVVHPRTRPHALTIALASATSLVFVATFVPSFGQSLLRVTRIVNTAGTSGSNQVRSIVGAQAIRDVHHSPIFGIGYQVFTEAQEVYLQELAVGGLLLFTSMAIYAVSGIVLAVRLAPRDTLAGMLGASILVTLALNFVEADLTDRFYYVPAALLVTLAYHHRIRPGSEAIYGSTRARALAAV
jgi:hypothetical protein